MVFKSLSSLPSFFRVITGLELHWMRDRPVGGKEEKKSKFEVFFTQSSLTTVPDRAEHSKCLFQRQKFLRKLQLISEFSLIFVFFLPAACGFCINSFSVFYIFPTLLFERETNSRAPLLGFATLKGRRISTLLRRILNPILFLY